MYNGLLHAHSGLRWIVLIFLIITVIVSLSKWLSKDATISKGISSLFRFNTLFFHVQFVLGVILLFLSDKVNFSPDTWSNSAIRFFTLEHSLMMIIAVVLVTIAGARFKRLPSAKAKYKNIFIFNLIALLLVLAMIPWPFRGLGAGWF